MPCAVTTDCPSFAGIVLAGGASSRMGRDKAVLELHGRSLLQHAVDTLRAAGAEPVIISGHRPGFDHVPDRTPGLGPLGGLASVLSARPVLRDRLLLVVAVDTPRLQPQDLRALTRAAARQGRGACFHGSPLPLALYNNDQACRRLAQVLASGGKASVQRFAAMLGVGAIATDNVNLANVNTPDDWRRVTAGQLHAFLQ